MAAREGGGTSFPGNGMFLTKRLADFLPVAANDCEYTFTFTFSFTALTATIITLMCTPFCWVAYYFLIYNYIEVTLDLKDSVMAIDRC